MENRKKVKILEVDEYGFVADNGSYYCWNEVEVNNENEEEAFIIPPAPPKMIKFKCKPTFNFQSIEFEIECSELNLDPMFDLYKKVVEGLISVTPDQPKNGVLGKPASPKQIEIMDKFHINYRPGITYDEADAKIKESYNKSNAKSRSY